MLQAIATRVRSPIFNEDVLILASVFLYRAICGGWRSMEDLTDRLVLDFISHLLVDDGIVSDFLYPAGYHYYNPDTLELDGESNMNFAWVKADVTKPGREYTKGRIDEIRAWADEGDVVWRMQETFPEQINDKLKEKLTSLQPTSVTTDEDALALQTGDHEQTHSPPAPQGTQQAAAAATHKPIGRSYQSSWAIFSTGGPTA